MGGVCPSTVNPVAKTRATDAGAGNTHKEVRMHIKERVPRVLAAVAGTARAMRRHKRRTLAAGVALLLVTPLLTGSGVDAPAVHERKEQEAGDTSGTAIESRKENTMTTAVMNYGTMVVGERPRRSPGGAGGPGDGCPLCQQP